LIYYLPLADDGRFNRATFFKWLFTFDAACRKQIISLCLYSHFYSAFNFSTLVMLLYSRSFSSRGERCCLALVPYSMMLWQLRVGGIAWSPWLWYVLRLLVFATKLTSVIFLKLSIQVLGHDFGVFVPESLDNTSSLSTEYCLLDNIDLAAVSRAYQLALMASRNHDH